MLVSLSLALTCQWLPPPVDAPFGFVEEVGATGGTVASLRLGNSVTLLGDLDGGGQAELLVTFHREGIAVLRGESGALLRTHGSLALGPQSGAAALGDLDGDGVEDYGYLSKSATGWLVLHVYSGASGALHFEKTTSIWSQSAHELEVVGGHDVDADGVPDIAVASRAGTTGPAAPTNLGAVAVYSGRLGSDLYDWYGSVTQEGLGDEVALVQDTNGDGHAEILALSWEDLPGLHRCTLRSGADGSVLWTRLLDHTGVREVCAPGDMDEDGIPDVALTTDDELTLLSGFDGSLLREREISYSTTLGNVTRLCSAGDLDGDGTPDLVAPWNHGVRILCGRTLRDLASVEPSAPSVTLADIDAREDPAAPGSLLLAFGRPSHSPGTHWLGGRVELARFRPGLRLGGEVLHVLQPQPMDWHIDLGPAYAGRACFLVASSLGVGDSVFLGTRVPLDLGGEVSTLPLQLPPGVAARPRRLDATGGASGSLQLDGGRLLPYVGTHLWFSAVVPSLARDGGASLAVPVLLVP